MWGAFTNPHYTFFLNNPGGGGGGIEEKRMPEEAKERVKVETRNEVDERDYETEDGSE